jgi:hypothetical protein
MMFVSTRIAVVLSFAVAYGSVAFSNAERNERQELGQVVPASASSTSMAALEAEISDLRSRLDSIEWAQETPYVPAANDYVAPGWLISVDYLNWDVRQRSTDFAITTDDGALAVGQGTVHRMDFDRNSGVRGRLSYRTGVGWELGVVYTYFRTTGAASAVEPEGGNMWATRSHPARYEEAGTADASGIFSLSSFDLEARYPIVRQSHVDMHLFGGLRWSEIDQEFRVRYDKVAFQRALYRDRSDMTGFGLRMCIETRWWWNSSWSVFGTAAGSILYGRFRTHLYEDDRNCAPDPCRDVIVDVRDAYGQPVPGLDAAVGVSWNRGPLQIRGGYEMHSWFNLADRSMFPDEQHEGAYSPLSTDVLLDGFFIRFAYQF